MIAFVENGKAVLAISTYDFTYYGNMDCGTNPENVPIFKTPGSKTVVGIDNGNTIADVLRYEKISLSRDVSEEEIVDKAISKYVKALLRQGLYDAPSEIHTTFLFARNGKIMVSGTDPCVFDGGEYYSVGNDNRLECVLLENTKGMPTEDRIRAIYNAKESFFRIHQFPVVYMDSETCRLHVVEKEGK